MLRLTRTRALTSITHRLYAKVVKETKNDADEEEKIGRDEEELMEAMKDFLRRPPQKWVKPNTELQFKQEQYLSEQYSRWMKLKWSAAREEYMKKSKKMREAVESLPEELRREASKTDWELFPPEMAVMKRTLPPQQGYDPPVELLKNEL